MSTSFTLRTETITIHAPGRWSGDALKAYRQSQGWTQSAMGDILGYNHVSISLWENGRQEIPKYVCRMLDILIEKPSVLDLFTE